MTGITDINNAFRILSCIAIKANRKNGDTLAAATRVLETGGLIFRINMCHACIL